MLDISHELIINRCGNGIKLDIPSAGIITTDSTSVANVLTFPFNVYFLDRSSICRNANEHMAHTHGLQSLKDSVGHSVRAVLATNEADALIAQDQEVINRKQIYIGDDSFCLVNGLDRSFISLKFPVYDQAYNVTGVFGAAILLGSEHHASKIAEFFRLISKTVYFNSPINPLSMQHTINKKQYYFTKRETEILRLLVRGKSMREIGRIFNISHRTVERHCENAKIKAGVNSKSELIEKILYNFI